MLAEPMTLYKLMNLYMLHQVNFPLTNAQLSNFFLDREYTTYFTLQQALNELLDAGLVKKETMRNSSRYEITKEGEETLEFFGKNISPAIVSDMDEYLKQNRFRMRNEVGLILASSPTSINQQTRTTSFTARCGKEKPFLSISISPFRIRSRRKSCAITGRIEAKRFMLM